MTNNILLLSDNRLMLERFRNLEVVNRLEEGGKYKFDYAFSHRNKALLDLYKKQSWIRPLNVKENVEALVERYAMVISLHCKQLFPEALVNGVRCVNVHPGLNPYNRGWFPQVFSILNGLPSGATIHEIDEKLDHGPVICQKEVKIEVWDTSYSAYHKILNAEIELLNQNLESIVSNNYTKEVKEEGNLNLKKDFDKLCKIDLQEKDTFLNHINRLRALTHGDYANAFFLDDEGKKVFIKVEINREGDSEKGD